MSTTNFTSNFERMPYPAEFRREAVELVRSGRSCAEVAAGLDVSVRTLRRWRRQAEVEAGEREGLSSGERSELNQLRRQVRLLEQEREVLKKAAAFFARESGTR
jgi:transposase